MSHQWAWQRIDKPGVWAFGGHDSSTTRQLAVTSRHIQPRDFGAC